MNDVVLGELFEILKDWYEGERPAANQEPLRNSMCAGLAVLEIMRGSYPITQNDYLTEKNQVRTSGPKIQRILKRYGENRLLASEGGRTTRSTRTSAEHLVQSLNKSRFRQQLGEMSPTERGALIDQLQGWLVERVREYFDRKPIAVRIDLTKQGWEIVADVLNLAAAENKAGAVSQHLVGAKLALRYPHVEIENYSHTTADQQLGRPGDFVVGDTVFHVTVAPMPGVFEKCKDNIRNGYRVLLLVPGRRVAAATQFAEAAGLENHIGVVPIESFVGQNVEEMAGFSRSGLKHTMVDLLHKYNERVAEVEADKSLLIEIPGHLESDD